MKPAYTETYTFKVISDDGARLWVNGHFLFDTFDAQSGIKVNTGRVNLHANRFYDIRLEYREATGPASIQMRWRSAHRQYETIVPSTRLFPPAPLSGDALRAKLDDVMNLAAQKYKATLARPRRQYRGLPRAHRPRRRPVARDTAPMTGRAASSPA